MPQDENQSTITMLQNKIDTMSQSILNIQNKFQYHFHNGNDSQRINYADVLAAPTAQAFPVGAIYMNTTNVNPNTELGYGTWVALGAGQVLAGFKSGDADFGTMAQTGGVKTVSLSTSQIPSHAHTTQNMTFNTANNGGGSNTVAPSLTINGSFFANTDNTGGGGSHTNLQPYIVVAMWKRTV